MSLTHQLHLIYQSTYFKHSSPKASEEESLLASARTILDLNLARRDDLSGSLAASPSVPNNT
jgi:hypothetical protein